RPRSYAAPRIEVRECLDGRLVALNDARVLAAQPSPGPEFVLDPRADPGRARQQRLRRPHRHSDVGGRHLPPGQNRTRVSLAALTELAHALRRPARGPPRGCGVPGGGGAPPTPPPPRGG